MQPLSSLWAGNVSRLQLFVAHIKTIHVSSDSLSVQKTQAGYKAHSYAGGQSTCVECAVLINIQAAPIVLSSWLNGWKPKVLDWVTVHQRWDSYMWVETRSPELQYNQGHDQIPIIFLFCFRGHWFKVKEGKGEFQASLRVTDVV